MDGFSTICYLFGRLFFPTSFTDVILLHSKGQLKFILFGIEKSMEDATAIKVTVWYLKCISPALFRLFNC